MNYKIYNPCVKLTIPSSPDAINNRNIPMFQIKSQNILQEMIYNQPISTKFSNSHNVYLSFAHPSQKASHKQSKKRGGENNVTESTIQIYPNLSILITVQKGP